jgi:hypothetical protein
VVYSKTEKLLLFPTRQLQRSAFEILSRNQKELKITMPEVFATAAETQVMMGKSQVGCLKCIIEYCSYSYMP